MSLRIETLAIGDELLTGKIADTNSQYVAGQLFANGLVLSATSVIPDNPDVILSYFNSLSERADVVVVFGGLGPTTDDLTVDCAARAIKSDTAIYFPAKERLEKMYADRRRTVNADALRQVRYPRNAEPFANGVGLAPGFTMSLGKCRFYFLPGVPAEMRPMVEDSVLPGILGIAGKTARLLSHSWHCMGIAESVLQGLMHPVEAKLPAHARIGYRTSPPENEVVLYYQNLPDGNGMAEFEKLCGEVRSAIGTYAYSERYDTLEGAVVSTLRALNQRIALVESCTGGLVTHRLTRIPGSSNVVWGGYAVYRVEAKAEMLGVTLQSEAEAVSKACSLRLAQQALKSSGCDVAAAITGYMGPDGGTDKDPIGTIYMAVVNRSRVAERRAIVDRPERERKQWAASAVLLDEILRFIQAG
ncbi:MAG: nicotinamide-nucleotide amidohydrolase family protein [Bdellovibrionales bacterium]|nr:nicotinamide-nucleotide amidohydrolase family protein [Bdellovibrionales bacterium]